MYKHAELNQNTGLKQLHLKVKDLQKIIIELDNDHKRNSWCAKKSILVSFRILFNSHDI